MQRLGSELQMLCTVLLRGRKAMDFTVGCASQLSSLVLAAEESGGPEDTHIISLFSPLSFLKNHYCKPQGESPEACFLMKQKATSISIYSMRDARASAGILSPSPVP